MDGVKVVKVRQPRNAIEGVGLGLLSVAGGVVGGVASLFVAPVVGYKQGGAKGLAKGATAGLFGVVALPIAGIAEGAKQVGQGMYNTPKAIRKAVGKPRPGDEDDKATYIMFQAHDPTGENEADRAQLLNSLLESVKDQLHVAGGGSYDPSGLVKDMYYYNLMESPSTATPSEIKKNYYRLAREWHPDKNPSEEAHAKFQEIGKAYQILSDPQRREAYDKYGRESVANDNFIDPGTLFVMLFGGEKFEPFVGKLALAASMEPPTIGQDGEMKDPLKEQIAREESLAVVLAVRLQSYVDGGEESFREKAVKDTQELILGSYGKEMLSAIGFVYASMARTALKTKGLGIKAIGEEIKLMKHANRTQKAVAIAAYNLQEAQEKIKEARAAGNEVLEEELQKAAMPLMQETLWRISLVDIESTVIHVCERVLSDGEIDDATRVKRAEGLLLLGNIFQDPSDASSSS